MESNFQEELEQLRKENEALRNEMGKASEKKKRKQERTKKTLSWTWSMFAGASLKNNFNISFSYISNKFNIDSSYFSPVDFVIL